MISKDIFKLTFYKGVNNKIYYFFDGMFKLNNQPKEKILASLCLPSSTYRVNRQSQEVKNDNHIILMKYFNVNNNEVNLEDTELLFWQIFLTTYYDADLAQLEAIVDARIDDNNYLKPLYILFKTMINICSKNTISSIRSKITSNIKYLEKFPDEYYVNDFYVLYKILLFFYYDEIKYINGLFITSKYDYLEWFYFQMKAAVAYNLGNYFEAIVYYQNAIRYYSAETNINRTISCEINVAGLYNYVAAYDDSFRLSEKLLDYSLMQSENVVWKKYTIMHCLVSLLMTNKFEKIKKLYNVYQLNLDFFNSTSRSVIIIMFFLDGFSRNAIEEKLSIANDDALNISYLDYLYNEKELADDFEVEKKYLYYNLIITKLKNVKKNISR